MKQIISAYQLNKGIKPIFSEIAIFDWYDGPISGMGKLVDANEYYLFNIVAWDAESDIRIFSTLKLQYYWIEKFKEAIEKNNDKITMVLHDFCAKYNDDIYLIKSKSINDLDYEITEIENCKLEFYETMESVANQSEEERNGWFRLFNQANS